MLTARPELLLQSDALVGEGPFYVEETGELHWVDIERGEIHCTDVATARDRHVRVGERVGSAVPSRIGPGWVAGLRDGVALVAPDGSIEVQVGVEDDRPSQRMNDGACDSRGRFWTGTMDEEGAPGVACLYRVEKDLTVTQAVSGVALSNGLGWSPDERLFYYVDSRKQTLDVFDFDVDAGSLAKRRVLVEIPEAEGMPDGLAVDDAGCIWLALWQGASVRRYTPEGRLDALLELPISQVTSCAFGGPGGDTLFITSGSTGLSAAAREREPLAGSVFAWQAPVAGPPAHRFG